MVKCHLGCALGSSSSKKTQGGNCGLCLESSQHQNSITCQMEKEAQASTRAFQRFPQYLIRNSFYIETDHKPLIPLLGSKSLDEFTARIQWLNMCLMRFSYTISHMAGKDNVTVDLLSRATVCNTVEGTQEEEFNLYVDSVIASLPAADLHVGNPYNPEQECHSVASEVLCGRIARRVFC